MKSPAQEGLFDGNILEVLPLACMQSLLQKREILHVAPILCDNAFSHKKKKSLQIVTVNTFCLVSFGIE